MKYIYCCAFVFAGGQRKLNIMRKFDLQRVRFLCWTAFICGALVGFMTAMVLYAFGIWW